VLVRLHERLTTKINSKNSLSPLRHFTEQLVGVFGKLPRENDLDHEFSKLLIRWLYSTSGTQPATNQSQHKWEKEITPGAERNSRGPSSRSDYWRPGRTTEEPQGRLALGKDLRPSTQKKALQPDHPGGKDEHLCSNRAESQAGFLKAKGLAQKHHHRINRRATTEIREGSSHHA
jgi:hypothetical protein